MKFGSPEYFWLALFGLTIIAGVTSGSMVKGLMSGAFGLVLSTIGMDPMEGVERYMFGIDALYNGINVTCAMIGLFSMSQVFILIEKAIKERGNVIDFEDSVFLKAKELAQIFPHVIRSWLIGNIIGILPGAGASIACFLGIRYLTMLRRGASPEDKAMQDLDYLSYRMIAFGFIFLTLVILTGCIWAEQAWSTFWSWDPKETWALITWIIYAIYLHLRINRKYRGKKMAVYVIVAMICVIFTFVGVNQLMPGLHSYG